MRSAGKGKSRLARLTYARLRDRKEGTERQGLCAQASVFEMSRSGFRVVGWDGGSESNKLVLCNLYYNDASVVAMLNRTAHEGEARSDTRQGAHLKLRGRSGTRDLPTGTEGDGL